MDLILFNFAKAHVSFDQPLGRALPKERRIQSMEEAKLITIEEEFLWKFVIMKPTTNIEGKEREKIF